jgi:hypothetical protein
LQKQKIGGEAVSANGRSRKLVVRMDLQTAEAEKTTKKTAAWLVPCKIKYINAG